MLAPQGQSPPSPDSDLESIRRRAERAYDRTLATLWIGNGVAALATVAYITANRHDGTFTRSLLIPLILFVVGLSITGISSPNSRVNVDASPIWKMQIRQPTGPSGRAALIWIAARRLHWRPEAVL